MSRYVIWSRKDDSYYSGPGIKEPDGRKRYARKGERSEGTIWVRRDRLHMADVFTNKRDAQRFARAFANLEAEAVPLPRP